MKLLLLTLGDGESWQSWSGSTRSLVDHLRNSGHSVLCRNVDLQGLDKWWTALYTLTLDRRRWWVRYQLGSRGFAARSRRAQAAVDDAALDIDAILQIGATVGVAAPEEVMRQVFGFLDLPFGEIQGPISKPANRKYFDRWNAETDGSTLRQRYTDFRCERSIRGRFPTLRLQP